MPGYIGGRCPTWLFLLAVLICSPAVATSGLPYTMQIVDGLISEHPGQDGVFVLDSGQYSLMSRAWLAQKAERSIDVQYFIWSSDNIGILAAEALLSAAERGVQVRVIVDDLLVDAEEETLLALAAHPNVHIKIYNPKHSVGISTLKRLFNVASDFHGANQRMHDKTFIVDGKIAITGGRNMADEYYDYDQAYNFRDRDLLVMGPVVADMTQSFERFWNHQLAMSIRQLLPKDDALDAQRIEQVYAELHAYAEQPENFAPEVRLTVANLHDDFLQMIGDIVWCRARFINDDPGKNSEQSFSAGGRSTRALTEALAQARQSVVIQSPYLVMPGGGIAFFRSLIERGVKVSVSTNSLASTDNMMAYSGFSKQREALLAAGIDVYEFKPYPKVQQAIMHRIHTHREHTPIFAIHAKTLVIDGRRVFVGTFNLDPRSANLNTEVGILVDDARLATQVEADIRTDMMADNSWHSAGDEPDQYASWWKRVKLWFLKWLPLEPVL